jgi:hypothetical protein
VCYIFHQVKEPKHEVVIIKREDSEEQASSAIREVFQRIAMGGVKKKVILKVEGRDE